MFYGFWVIVIAFLVGLNCSLLGNWLLLRKQVMLGDAVSHAALPGIVLAVLFTGSMDPFLLLVGATAAGLGTLFLVAFLDQRVGTGLEEAIGFSFTSFFALGILLASLYAHKADLDVPCVLYGNLVLAPLEGLFWGSTYLGPKAFFLLLTLLVLNLAFLFVGHRALLLTSFDPGYAKLMGLLVGRWNAVFMVLLALNLTLVFKYVGGILAVAFLVLPPATGYLLHHSLSAIFWSNVALVAAMSLGGYGIAWQTYGSVVGSMVTLGGLFFALAFFWQKRSWQPVNTD